MRVGIIIIVLNILMIMVVTMVVMAIIRMVKIKPMVVVILIVPMLLMVVMVREKLIVYIHICISAFYCYFTLIFLVNFSHCGLFAVAHFAATF